MYLSQLYEYKARAKIFVDLSKLDDQRFDCHKDFWPLWRAIIRAGGQRSDCNGPRLSDSYGSVKGGLYGPCLIDFILDETGSEIEIPDDPTDKIDREELLAIRAAEDQAIREIKALAKVFGLPVFENIEADCQEIEDCLEWYE
jgi:hypothetical protein